jgi:hypothetical protein
MHELRHRLSLPLKLLVLDVQYFELSRLAHSNGLALSSICTPQSTDKDVDWLEMEPWYWANGIACRL